MTDMEHAIEQAARTILDANAARIARYPMVEPISVQAARQYARALAEEGLLSPAPLREEWGAEMDHPTPDSPPSTIKARDLENARWQVENNPKVATGRIMHRYMTDWEHAEGECWDTST